MPLKKHSQKTISKNISELCSVNKTKSSSKRSIEQIIAIAMSITKKSKKRKMTHNKIHSKENLMKAEYVNIDDKIVYKQYKNKDYVWYVKLENSKMSDKTPIKIIKVDDLHIFKATANHIDKE